MLPLAPVMPTTIFMEIPLKKSLPANAGRLFYTIIPAF